MGDGPLQLCYLLSLDRNVLVHVPYSRDQIDPQSKQNSIWIEGQYGHEYYSWNNLRFIGYVMYTLATENHALVSEWLFMLLRMDTITNLLLKMSILFQLDLVSLHFSVERFLRLLFLQNLKGTHVSWLHHTNNIIHRIPGHLQKGSD